MNCTTVTGWWFQPLWKILVSWADFSHILWKIENVPNHQPVNININNISFSWPTFNDSSVNALNPRHLRGPQRQVARKPSVKPGPHNAGIVETQLRLLMLHLSPYRHAQNDQRIHSTTKRCANTHTHTLVKQNVCSRGSYRLVSLLVIGRCTENML